MEYLRINQDSLIHFGVLLALLLFIIQGNRYFTYFRFKRRLTDELAERDNFAYAIAYGGTLFGYFISLSEPVAQLNALNSLDYAPSFILAVVTTIVLLEIGRSLHNRVFFSHLDEYEQIKEKNIASALMDVGAMLHNGILLYALMSWFGINSYSQLTFVVISFFLCQIPVYLTIRWRERLFKRHNQGCSMQHFLGQNNIATALRQCGYLLVTGLSFPLANKITAYQAASQLDSLMAIFIVGSMTVLVMTLTSFLLSRFALQNIPTNVEIDQQDNLGVALVEMSIMVSYALLMLFSFS
ncbi:DUF350 domain-containing protein [Flocculibacter collagenilyticus]|uniref:DUF350 domain-containing protein n=1 Tax=Flocculibacter collagenilyticus TaxID=2744479 RepID=UPI0018F516F0|nr:hypothetical protein [Flocculibacter collagenilyticus]